jgi:hypothetical protein
MRLRGRKMTAVGYCHLLTPWGVSGWLVERFYGVSRDTDYDIVNYRKLSF